MIEVLAKQRPNACLRAMYRSRSPATVDRKALFPVIVPPGAHKRARARAAPLYAGLLSRDAGIPPCSPAIDDPKRRRSSSAERPAGAGGEHKSGECNGLL